METLLNLKLLFLGIYVVLTIFLTLLPYLVNDIAEVLLNNKYKTIYYLSIVLLPLTIIFCIALIIGFTIILLLEEYEENKELNDLHNQKKNSNL